MTASFAQIAQDTAPARNFSTGFVIFVQLREPSSDVTALFLGTGEEGRYPNVVISRAY